MGLRRLAFVILLAVAAGAGVALLLAPPRRPPSREAWQEEVASPRTDPGADVDPDLARVPSPPGAPATPPPAAAPIGGEPGATTATAAEGPSVRFRIVEPEGALVEGAFALAIESAPGAPTHSARPFAGEIGRGGRSALLALAPGRYRVEGEAQDRRIRRVHFVANEAPEQEVVLVAQPKLLLRVTAVDAESGAPVPGVGLELASDLRTSAEQTGEDGAAILEADALGEATIKVKREGYAGLKLPSSSRLGRWEMPVQVTEDLLASGLRLELLQGFTLTGRVVEDPPFPTSEDVPIAGAEVHVEDETARTDDSGRFRIVGLEQPQVAVNVSHAKYPAATFPVKLPQPEKPEARFRLERPREVRGRLLRLNGEPIPGGTVTITTKTGERTSSTGPDGSFRVAPLDRGPHSLLAWAPGFVAYALKRLETQNDVDLDLSLDPSAPLSGRLVEHGSGAPVKAGGTVVVAAPPTPKGEARAADGRFAFEHLPAGSYDLAARVEGYAPATLNRVSTGAAEVTIELKKLARILGEVRPAPGEPGARLRFSWSRGTEGPSGSGTCEVAWDGRFLIPDVDPDATVLVAHVRGFAPFVAYPSLQPGADAPMVLDLEAGASIAGIVVGPGGAPLADAEVALLYSDKLLAPIEVPPMRTGVDGTFRIQGDIAGNVRIRVRGDGFSERNEYLRLRRGEERTGVRIVLRPAPAPGRRGHVDTR